MHLDELPENDTCDRESPKDGGSRNRSSSRGVPRRSSSSSKGRYKATDTVASKAISKEQKTKSTPPRSSRSLSPQHKLPDSKGIIQMEQTRALSSVQEVLNESMNGSILFPLSSPFELKPCAAPSTADPSIQRGISPAPTTVREGDAENHAFGENSILFAPVGKLNSLERLLDLPDVGHSKRRTSRLLSGANSVQSGVSKLSYNSFSASNDSSMPSLSSFAEQDLSSVGNFSFMTMGTNISGDASVVTTGANSVMTSESDVKSMASSACARVPEGASTRPIILSLIPQPDARNVMKSHSYSSVMTNCSGSTTQSDVPSISRASHPPLAKGARPNRRGKGSPTPVARHVIMAVNSDVQYDLEGTTLDVLGPNIANPHKNKPQARWESVSQPKKNVHAVTATPGNEHVAPLTHSQKNLLPAKKDAMPMYRRPRSMSNPSSPTETVGSNSVSSAAMTGRQSHKLGDMWKTLLLEPPPVIKDHDFMKKDFQPIAVTRHDSFGETHEEEPLNLVDARARSRSDNDIDLFESFSSFGPRENWRDDSDTLQSALFASQSSGIVLITSPTPTWEYEEPTTTASTSASRRADSKPRSSSSRRRSISNSMRSSSRSTRSNDSSKGVSSSGVSSVPVPPPPPPPPPPLPM